MENERTKVKVVVTGTTQDEHPTPGQTGKLGGDGQHDCNLLDAVGTMRCRQTDRRMEWKPRAGQPDHIIGPF